ncbi:MAG TPA: hypothetical protein VFV34_06700, partial [Blastocatellia bacterium]|nr:hypothetical protein [Blastocatellia bacterium]
MRTPGSLAAVATASILVLTNAMAMPVANRERQRPGAGVGTQTPTSPVDTLSPEQRKQVIKRLNGEPFSPIQFENRRSTPLSIADAKARSISIQTVTGGDLPRIT